MITPRRDPRRAKPTLALDRGERVRFAIEIIGADKAQASALARDVNIATHLIDRLKHNKVFGEIRTKPEQTAIESFAAALRRLRTTYRSPDLNKYVRVAFQLDEIDFERWIKYCEAAAATPLITARTKGRRSPDTAAKLQAAKTAHRLLERHGLAIKRTRGGKFCELAAVLYGDKTANMFEPCRAVLPRPERGGK